MRTRILNTRTVLMTVALLVGSVLTAAPALAQVHDFTQIVKDNRNAVVHIASTQDISSQSTDGMPPEGLLKQLPPDSPFRQFFKHFRQQQPRGKHEREALGSGFIISSDGYILTNAHVIKDADKIVVKLHDRREFDAKVVGSDKPSDVALLKIDANDLPIVHLGDSDKLQVGQPVLAIGSPFGLDYTATQGIVSALNRNLPDTTYTPFIQTDVAVNPGNSGGPLFNLDGKVVGINSQIYSRTGGYMGLSFAVPINVAKNVVKQIKENGSVKRGYLGVTIQPVDRGLAQSFGLKKPSGALVSDVMDDTPAAHAGVKDGDVILSFNGHKIATAANLPPIVGRTMPGQTVDMTVMRNKKRKTIEVKVGKLSDYSTQEEAENGDSGSSTPGDNNLNLAVRQLSGNEREKMNLGDRGLLVQRVGAGPAADAGIRPGDILLRLGGHTLSTMQQLREAVASLPHGRPVAVQIRRGDHALFVSLTLPGKKK